MKAQIAEFFRKYEYAIVAWVLIIIFLLIGLYYGVDEHIIGAVVVLVGIIGQAFAALIAWIGLVPVIGPIAAKVLMLPFIWLINGVGYLVSIVAIRRGYSKDVLNYRVVTYTLLIGITIGYILGKIV